MRLSACQRLALRPLTGVWSRVINKRYWKTRLSARHSKTGIGRFNAGSEQAPSFQVLYLAENHQSALFEVGALLGEPERPIKNPHDRTVWLTLSLDVVLQYVADLTDVKQQRMINTSIQELTGPWDHDKVGQAPTQKLGQALFETPRLEAFLAPSAAHPNATNLIVFPEKLNKNSQITFFNEETGKTERLKP